MNQKTFPFQQGDLDSLCSVYSVINLLHQRGKIKGVREAYSCFEKVVNATKKEKDGDVAALTLAGCDPKDVIWILSELDAPHAVMVKNPSAKAIVEAAQRGAIIFFTMPNDYPDETFDHYTVVRPDSSLDELILIDSYGFENILCRHNKWWIDGNEVVISHLYSLTSN